MINSALDGICIKLANLYPIIMLTEKITWAFFPLHAFCLFLSFQNINRFFVHRTKYYANNINLRVLFVVPFLPILCHATIYNATLCPSVLKTCIHPEKICVEKTLSSELKEQKVDMILEILQYKASQVLVCLLQWGVIKESLRRTVWGSEHLCEF